MSDDHAPPPLEPVIIVLRQDAVPASEESIDALTEQLAARGVTELKLDRLSLFGIVTGQAPADQLDAIRELDPVESVEPDETMHLRREDDASEDTAPDPSE